MKAEIDIAKVKAFMVLQSISENELARRVGVAASTINRVLSRKRSASAKIVQGLLLIGMRAGDIFLHTDCQKVKPKRKKAV